MHGKVGILDYRSQEKHLPKYDFHCNASYVSVYREGTLVYKREVEMDSWYDDGHKAIVNAMEVLERAVLAAVKA